MFNLNMSLKAKNIDEAVELMAKYPDAVLVAGGTDVMIKLRAGKLNNPVLISILDMEEIKGIKMLYDGTIEIGAGTKFDDIRSSEIINKYIPMLSFACNHVGSPQIRSIATIGGNLCNGAVSADSVPSLYALDAKLEMVGPNGKEIVSIHGFHTGPGKTVIQHTGKILTKILISKESYENAAGWYYKSGQRRAMEISSLGCAVCLKLNNDKTKLEWIHMAFGVAAPVPVRVPKLESYLEGHELNEELFEYIQDHVLEELSPRDSWRASLTLRTQLIKTLSVRATRNCIENLGGCINA